MPDGAKKPLEYASPGQQVSPDRAKAFRLDTDPDRNLRSFFVLLGIAAMLLVGVFAAVAWLSD